MKAAQKVVRLAAVLSSIALAGGYIWYNASQASRQPDPPSHPEPVAESKSEPGIGEATVVVPVSSTQKTTDTQPQPTFVFPGSKSLVLPGSKFSTIDIGKLATPTPTPPADQKPAQSPPVSDQKPAQSPPPVPEGKK